MYAAYKRPQISSRSCYMSMTSYWCSIGRSIPCSSLFLSQCSRNLCCCQFAITTKAVQSEFSLVLWARAPCFLIFPSSRRRILLFSVELFPNLSHTSSWGHIQALEWWVFLCINLSPVQLHFPRHLCAVTSLHWSSPLLLFLVAVNICIAINLFTLELWAHWFSHWFKWGKYRACRSPCTCSRRNYWTPHGAAKQNWMHSNWLPFFKVS